VRAAIALYRGDCHDGLRCLAEKLRLGLRGEDRQRQLMGQADLLVRLRREREALPLYAEALARLAELSALCTGAIWGDGMFALARLRSGDRVGAFESAAPVERGDVAHLACPISPCRGLLEQTARGTQRGYIHILPVTSATDRDTRMPFERHRCSRCTSIRRSQRRR
jgi:hypothetical protein